MKIRYGFVSNSSSSSFIIGFKKSYNMDHTCPTCGNSTNILKIIKLAARNSCETQIDAEGFDEIVKHYSCSWEWSAGTKKNETIKILTEFLKDKDPNEYELMALSIDNNDGFLIELIRNDKNITIIEGGGY